jgi:uncharacterized protein YeaO (DUF488 family)
MSRVCTLEIKRIYEPAASADGVRALVDGMRPRGLTKKRVAIDVWLKDIAPSAALRGWLGRDPKRWPAFHERYFKEFGSSPEEVKRLVLLMSARKVMLLFGAHHTNHNNAVTLADYLPLPRR